MTDQRLEWTKARLAKLEGSPKNIKCPGVIRKLRRQVIKEEQKRK